MVLRCVGARYLVNVEAMAYLGGMSRPKTQANKQTDRQRHIAHTVQLFTCSYDSCNEVRLVPYTTLVGLSNVDT